MIKQQKALSQIKSGIHIFTAGLPVNQPAVSEVGREEGSRRLRRS